MDEEIERNPDHAITNTKFVGHYRHVIRLYYPCEMFEDTRDAYGEPPTLQIIADTLARHRKECEICY